MHGPETPNCTLRLRRTTGLLCRSSVEDRAGILPLRFAHPAVLFALNSPSVICYLRSVPFIQLLELPETIPSAHRTG